MHRIFKIRGNAAQGQARCKSFGQRNVHSELKSPESSARFRNNNVSSIQRNYSESANARDAPNSPVPTPWSGTSAKAAELMITAVRPTPSARVHGPGCTFARRRNAAGSCFSISAPPASKWLRPCPLPRRPTWCWDCWRTPAYMLRTGLSPHPRRTCTRHGFAGCSHRRMTWTPPSLSPIPSLASCSRSYTWSRWRLKTAPSLCFPATRCPPPFTWLRCPALLGWTTVTHARMPLALRSRGCCVAGRRGHVHRRGDDARGRPGVG